MDSTGLCSAERRRLAILDAVVTRVRGITGDSSPGSTSHTKRAPPVRIANFPDEDNA